MIWNDNSTTQGKLYSYSEHNRSDAPSYKTRLPSRVAPINLQIRACHKTTRIANQKYRRAAVLVWPAQFAQHILRRPVAPPLGVLLEEVLHHGGHDVAGRDGVDADAVGSPFRGEVAGELDDGGFGGVVGGADEALQKS